MTNREWIVWLLGNTEYDDEYITTAISDYLMEITDEDDCSIAVICGKDRELLIKWLGEKMD